MDGRSLTGSLALELARVTQAAALAAGRLSGRGQKELADQVAVEAMRRVLQEAGFASTIVIGEGEKDHAPMLREGEVFGRVDRPALDIAVDPVDGTRLLANGMPNAISVVAAAERGSLYAWERVAYMEKIAVGPRARGAIDLRDTPAANLDRIAVALGRPVEGLTVVVLDRPRHEDLIAAIQAAGAQVKTIVDGDVAGAIMCGLEESGIDVMMGVGGSPEAVLAACAIKCLGGDMQCRLWDGHQLEGAAPGEFDTVDFGRIWEIDDLVRSERVAFSATGITDGDLLRGVSYGDRTATTQTLVLEFPAMTRQVLSATHELTTDGGEWLPGSSGHGDHPDVQR